MSQTPQLYVATYHYVRDLPRSRFPQIKGMLLDDFRQQMKSLPGLFELATLNSALDFLTGTYRPRRDLCLLTFDDGLKEHYGEVTPILAEQGIQGVFFPITSCMADQVVAPVHMNHFLSAALGSDQYCALFMEAFSALGLEEHTHMKVDPVLARQTYPLDQAETARFKYLFNFLLPPGPRDVIVKGLFAKWIGDESAFAADLYFSWTEAREMQRAGMVIGGHSHTHRPLARLETSELELELGRCWELMRANLESQDFWPFSYPYGKADSFDGRVIETLRRLGFCCSLSTESGMNLPGVNRFAIRRVDCKKIIPTNQLEPPAASRPRTKSVGASAA